MWQRPATHALHKYAPVTPSLLDEDDNLSELSAKPAVPGTTRAYMEDDQGLYDDFSEDPHSTDGRVEMHVESDEIIPDYRKIVEVGRMSLCLIRGIWGKEGNSKEQARSPIAKLISPLPLPL